MARRFPSRHSGVVAFLRQEQDLKTQRNKLGSSRVRLAQTIPKYVLLVKDKKKLVKYDYSPSCWSYQNVYIYIWYIYICMCVYIPYIPVTNKECISISPVRKPPKNDAWNRKKWVWIKIIHAKKCVSWYTESFAICGSRGNHMTWPMPHHSSLVHSSQGGKMPTNYLRACPLQNKNWLTE